MSNAKERKEYNKKYYQLNRSTINRKNKDYYIKYRDEFKRYNKKYHREYSNTLSGRFSIWKKNAERRKLRWQITFEYVESISKLCFYTGEKLTLKSNCYNTISLDRIDSKKGYIKNNVVACCSVINLMKNDLPINDFYKICKKITEHKTRRIK